MSVENSIEEIGVVTGRREAHNSTSDGRSTKSSVKTVKRMTRVARQQAKRLLIKKVERA